MIWKDDHVALDGNAVKRNDFNGGNLKKEMTNLLIYVTMGVPAIPVIPVETVYGKQKEGQTMGEEQLALTHVGEHQGDYLNAVTPPVFLTSLHIFDSMEEYRNHKETGAYVYGRRSEEHTSELQSLS